MCPPAALVGAQLALTAVQGATGFIGQTQAFNQQVEFYNDNAREAARATSRQWDATQLRISQEGRAATQKKLETALATKSAAATATVAAGEGGVSGSSVDAVLGDIYSRGARANGAVDENLQMTRDYLSAEMDGQRATGQNQINSVPLPQAPNPFAALLNVFGSGIGIYSNYRNNTR